MKTIALSLATVATAAAIVLLSTIPPSSAALFPFIHYHGHIVNELSANKVLLVDCQCSDHDLGNNYVEVGGEFEWSFKPHFLRQTLWHCYLDPDGTSHAYFVSYIDHMKNVDSHHNFIWVAKDDGVYARNPESRQDFFSYPWKPGHLRRAQRYISN
ncbi:S-protein homolog 1 [Linum grandiflorum]